MHRTAEEAVLLDHEQEIDTQRCIALQKELFSSSPFNTTHKALVNIQNVSSPSLRHKYEAGMFLKGRGLLHRKLIDNGDSDSQLPETITERSPKLSTTTSDNGQTEQSPLNKLNVPCPWKSPPSIDSLTQKSSMSMTQENPATAYAHLFSARKLDQLLFKLPDDNLPNITRNFSNQENGICDTKLIPGPDLTEKNVEIPDLSENSCAAPRIGMCKENQNANEPQTPNLLTNPFKTKGSIMQKIELFVATQPSSINQHFASPTSSRPSPDAFNNYSSPTKLLRINASPLAGYTIENKILDFSGDHLACSLPETKSNPNQNSFRKSCHYTSINGIQERKSQYTLSSTSEDSDSVSGSLPGLGPVREDQKEESFGEERRERKHHYKYRKTLIGREESHTKDSETSQENDSFKSRDFNSHETKKENNKFGTRSNEIREKSKFKLDKSILNRLDEIGNEKYYDSDALVQNTENKDQVTVLCSNEEIEPQLPKLQTQPIPSPNYSEKKPSKITPNDTFRDQSSWMPIKKRNLPCDDSETVPETSPLAQQLLPMKESNTISFNEVEDPAEDSENDDALRIHSSQVSLKNRYVSKKSRISPRRVQIYDKSTSKSLSPPKKSVHTNIAMDRDDSILSNEGLKANNYLNDRSRLVGVTSNNPEKNNIEEKAQSVSLDENNRAKEKFPNKSKENFNQKKSCPARIVKESYLVHDPITQSELTPKINDVTKHVSSSHSFNIKAEPGTRAKTDITNSLESSHPTNENSNPHISLETNSPIVNKNPRSTSRTQICSSKATSNKKKKKSDPASKKLITRRKLTEVAGLVSAPSTRSSTRQSTIPTTKEDSEDPLSLDVAPAPSASPGSGLFSKMAFAVSFVKNDKEKNHVIQLITENGGLLLEHGFDSLFEPISQINSTSPNETLSLSKLGKSLNFAGVIADEYSRKTKYVQALALDLPCLSGRWIQACITKNKILDWSPYLLCAGKSVVLGNACRSRILQPYSATNAELSHTFAKRKKIFQGKSVLLVMGRGRSHEKRKTFDFLTRALGPCRIGKVADLAEARKILSGSHSNDRHGWDLLHVHDTEKNPTLVQDSFLGNGRKRKFASVDQDQHLSSIPDAKGIRIITDEIMIQSLIFGELIEERV